MITPVNSNSADQPHKCRALLNTSSTLSYCTICGISLSENPKVKFIRPKVYSSINLFTCDPDLFLKNMITKQDTHRYYNITLPCKEDRLLMIEWMENLASMLGFKTSTFYTAVAIIDVILSLSYVQENRLKMVAYVCMSLAGKMEESYNQLPALDDIVKLFQNQFTVEDFINCEQIIFSMLGFNINIHTPYTFTSYFIFRGALSSNEIRYGSSNIILKDFEDTVELFLRVSLDCYELYQFKPIAVAASIIACARKYTGLDVYWSSHLETMSGLSWTNISACFELLETFAKMVCGDSLRIRGASPVSNSCEDSYFEGFCGDEQRDTQTQLNSTRDSMVITEFECFNNDDDNIFGEAQTVVLKFNV